MDEKTVDNINVKLYNLEKEQRGQIMQLNIIDIAKMAGCSTATVSRYFNSPDLISEKLRSRIETVVKEMNYQPNALARGLITNETKSIGLISPDINNVFYPAIIRGIEDYLQNFGYTAFVCNTDNNIAKEKHYINTYLEKRVDGLIFVGTRPNDQKKNEHIIQLSKKIPIVVISERLDTIDDDIRLCCIYSEETNGAYDAVKYLINLGHKRIAFFTSKNDVSTYVKKRLGYEKAMNEAGLQINESDIYIEEPYAGGGYRAALRMLANKERPSAVFAVSDQMAMGVIKAMHQSGLSIPEDLSLVGFSGVSISTDVFPELTTIDQEPYAMGAQASEMMLHLIKEKASECIYIPKEAKLILRDSCRAV